jgi:hypothetical protein
MAYGLRTSLLVLLGAGALGWALPRRILRNFIQALQTVWGRITSAAVRRPLIVVLLICIVALVPMIRLTSLVHHYGVNVPIFDDWAMAPLIVKAHTGQLKFPDIFQQQQEARTVLPNLIFILSAQSEWNVRDQMLLSVISCWITAAGLFVLLRRSALNLAAMAICFWLMVLALFSPAPFELWIFASGFPSFLPVLFLVSALVVIGAPGSTLWKFCVCGALAAASTFTLAHGLLAWGLTFPALLIAQRLPRWRAWLGLWIVMTAICATIYFWDYGKQPGLPGFAPAVSPLEYLSFTLQFLGGGLAYSLKHRPATAAMLFGGLQLALLVGVSIYTARRFDDRRFVAGVVPWFALAFYSLGSAVLAALGRVGYGASYALASRYVPFSLGLTLAVIALVALILNDSLKAGGSWRARRWGIISAAVLAIAYLVPYKVAAGNTLFFLRAYSANDRLARGAVLLSRVIDTRAIIKKKVFPPDPEYVVHHAAALDDLKLLRPPLARSNRLDAFPHEAADGTHVAGLCEAIRTDGESYHVSGWALLKAKGRPPDCVVISYELPGTEPILFAISDSLEMRWDIARSSWPNDYLWAGWSATFARHAVPSGAKLAFWAVDVDEPRLYRLEEAPDSSAEKP